GSADLLIGVFLSKVATEFGFHFVRHRFWGIQKRASRASGTLYLPKSVAAMDGAPVGYKIQSADFRERRQLGFLYVGDALLQIVNRRKLPKFALAHNFQRDHFAQTFHIAQSQSQREPAARNLFQRAIPIGTRQVDGLAL